MLCEHVLEFKCVKSHLQKYKCHTNQPRTCRICQRQDEGRQKELQEEVNRQAKRDQEQAEHAAKLAELDQQIRLVREKVADETAAEERAQALEQKKRDLDMARRLAQEPPNAAAKTKPEATNAQRVSSISEMATVTGPHIAGRQEKNALMHRNEIEDMKYSPEREWDRQKRIDCDKNASIDALMNLTGLKDVKSKILGIKAKVETVQRQGTDMKNERLGVVLLGNPGTGKWLTSL